MTGTNVKVYDFWAEWCGPCRMMAPVVEELEKNVPVVRVNIETDETGLQQKFNVRSIPTLVLVDDNDRELRRTVGAVSFKELREQLQF